MAKTVDHSSTAHRSTAARDLLIVFTFGLSLRTAWLILFPVPYGEDGFGRIYFQDTLFLSHWLPLTQVIVFLTTRLTSSIFLLRCVFAVLGSLAACGFYLFLRLILPRGTALLGGLLFAANTLFAILSLMPYQDVLFLGLLYGSLALLAPGAEHLPRILRRGQHRWGVLAFGLACLTRYESWFILPMLALWRWARKRPSYDLRGSVSSALVVLLSFGWAPLLWLGLSAFHSGSWSGFLFETRSGEFYAWNPHLDLAWMVGYSGRMLYWVGLFGSPLVLAAIPGLVVVARRRHHLHPALKQLFLLGALVLAFFFLIMGKGQDTVFRFSLIPLSIVLVLSLLGLEEIRCRLALHSRTALAASLVLLALLVLYTTVPLARLNTDPRYRDPYLISRFLDSRLKAGDRAMVVADRSRTLSDAAPILYQRIAAQSQHPRGTILAAGLLSITGREDLIELARRDRVRFLVVFENFEPWLPADMFFSELVHSDAEWVQPVYELSTARVYSVTAWPGDGGGDAR